MKLELEHFMGWQAFVYIGAITILLSFIAFCSRSISNALLLKPYDLTRGKGIHTIITSGFIHGGFGHLLFNMLTFAYFAYPLERILGSFRFIILYLFSMVFSVVWTIIRHRNDAQYGSLGASGAITGVMFSYILYEPNKTLIMPMIPIFIPAMLYAVIYIAYCLFQSMFSRDNINHDAHLWGGVGGILITLVLDASAYDRLIDLYNTLLSYIP